MVVNDLRMLLEKLNDYCTKSLETAVGLCVNRGHYEVRFEHLFLEFLDSTTSDIPFILNRFGIDSSVLKKALTKELETIASGNTGRPTFSPPLLNAFEHAWSISSLLYGMTSISSGTLLLAVLEQQNMSMSPVTKLLSSVNFETLKKDFLQIVNGSSEHTFSQAAYSPRQTGSKPSGDGQNVLSQFCINFTNEARLGKIDPILGRDNEIRQAIDILNRRRKNNPILVGEAGVGKTAIVEGIALRIAENDVPDTLKNVAIWGLDLGLLQAGASVKGEFEKRLKNVIDAIKNSTQSSILFIDEAHTIIGAGGQAGQGDAANLLKPALARGELRTLAATTWLEYRKYFEKDPALARRFQLVKIDEPSEETATIMLRGVADSFQKHHSVHITDDAIKAAVSWSMRYITGRQLPDKAVDVLDTACARVTMSQSVKPATLDNAERSLANTELKKNRLEQDSQNGIIISQHDIAACDDLLKVTREQILMLSKKWEQEKQQVSQIQQLLEKTTGQTKDDKALSLALATLKEIQGESPMVFPFVSAAVCGQIISDWTGIPVGSMVKDEAVRLLELEDRLKTRIIGQEDALSACASTIRASKTGMSNPDAPIGVFLFAGPSGVGKTECARALASILFGSDKFLTVINMSEYQEKHTVSQLKGSPPGYVGYGEGGVLTEAVRQKPYSIVLLDEVEKAHLEVMNLFYQVFDKGFMRDGEGREINFRNTIIIMTSNLASETIVDLCSGENELSLDNIVTAIRPELSSHFQPALVARTKIIPFKPLSKDVMKGVVAIKLDTIARRLQKTHGIAMSCGSELLEHIANACTAIETGARNVDAIIDGTLLPAISRQLLLHMDKERNYDHLHIGYTESNDFDIVFSNTPTSKEPL